MHISVITLFPEVFTYLDASIIKRAKEKGLVSIDFINPRDFTYDKHRTVDDIPYGGGSGMVLKPEPFFEALDSIREKFFEENIEVILTTPQGETYNQEMALKISKLNRLVLICGHYEGFDDRIRSLASMEISVGDYVLTGGELPAQIIIDSAVRLIPGVIDSQSAERESFYNSLLDYPHYTRPALYRDMEVPEVLLSGHHARIERWRKKESIRRTLLRRPDLLKKALFSPDEKKILKEVLEEEHRHCDFES